MRGHPGACWEATCRAASEGMCLQLGIHTPIKAGSGWAMMWARNGAGAGMVACHRHDDVIVVLHFKYIYTSNCGYAIYDWLTLWASIP